MKIGFLLHVYHLDTDGWERMVWGNPGSDELGTAAKFAECLLDIPADTEVVSIMYSGPSVRDGLGEGAYTKQYILDRLDQLASFPRLKRKLDRLSAAEYDCFVGRLRNVTLGPRIKNTLAEVESAGVYFRQQRAGKVFQIAAATHAPRCLRDQAAARTQGIIDKHQEWFMVAADVNYKGYTPDDIVIAEPLHRKDNPLYGFHPAWIEVTRPYSFLNPENKKKVLEQIDGIMAEALLNQPESTEVVN